MKRTTILSIAELLLSSVLLAQADEEQVFRLNRGTSPAPAEERTVTVGETAFQEVDQTEYLWAETRSDLVSSGTVLIPKGALLWAGSQKEKAKEFCSWGVHGRFCFWDDDGNGTFDRVKVIGGGRIPTVGGTYREVWKPGDDTSRNRRWELVYLGAGGGVLRFTAREYAGSAAAPITQDEVSYDLASGPTTIAYRGAKIEILEAGNSGLRYRVLTNSDGH